MMRSFVHCKFSKFLTFTHYLPIKARTLLRGASQNSKFLFSTVSNVIKQDRINDFNFNFFHHNPTYTLSCLQIDAKQCQKTPDMMKDAKRKLACLSSVHFVNNLSHDQVVKIMEFAARVKLEKNETMFNLVLIDKKCSSLVHDWSMDTILYIFDAWFLILQKKAFQTLFFSVASTIWFENCHTLSKNNVVQLVYYLGLYKKASNRMIKRLLEKFEEKQKEMNDTEIAIACLNFFKLRVKSVSPQMISRTMEVAQNLIIQNERFHLISILKFLRQLQVYDNTLGSMLQEYILREASSFNFVESTNFLATFSSESIYEEKVYQVLEKQGIIMLEGEGAHPNENEQHTHPSLRSRVKDLSRFLWAMVNVGHQLNHTTVEIVLGLVRMKHSKGEYRKQLHYLVDCLQSFAIINVYPKDMLRVVFTKDFLTLLQAQARVKPLYQMYFLYKSMEIECPELLELVVEENVLTHLKPLPKDLNKQIKERKDLACIFSVIKEMNLPDIQFELCTALPHIMILGMVVNKTGVKSNSANEKKNIYVEVLDSAICCRNSVCPTGLMIAKLRQLKKLNYNVITIAQDDISFIKRTSSHPNTKLQEIFL